VDIFHIKPKDKKMQYIRKKELKLVPAKTVRTKDVEYSTVGTGNLTQAELNRFKSPEQLAVEANEAQTRAAMKK